MTPAFRHGRGALTAKRDFEVRREHPDVITTASTRMIGQDRNGVLAFDDALKELKFA
jgi:hypothetical protein